eukprot:gene5374-4674_t
MLVNQSRLRAVNTYWHPRRESSVHVASRKVALAEVVSARADRNALFLAGDVNIGSCPHSYAKALATGLTPVNPEKPTNITPLGQSSPDVVMVSDHLRGCIKSKEVYVEEVQFSDTHVPFVVVLTLRALRMNSQSFSLRRIMVPAKQVSEICMFGESRARMGDSAQEVVQAISSMVSESQMKLAGAVDRPGLRCLPRSVEREKSSLKCIVAARALLKRYKRSGPQFLVTWQQEAQKLADKDPELSRIVRMPCDEAVKYCNARLRRARADIKERVDRGLEIRREKEKKLIWRLLINDLPALKRLIRTDMVNCCPIMAVYEGAHLRTEMKFVHEAMDRFWINYVFHQHVKTDSLPGPPPGYEEFVQGSHIDADRVAEAMEMPFQTPELIAAARKLNPKGVTLDAPPCLLTHRGALQLGPKSLEAFREVFNAFWIEQINLAIPLHLLLLMLPKGPELTNVKKRRPIGITSLIRRWLMLIICRRLMRVSIKFKLLHPTAYGFLQDVGVYDVIYPLQCLRDWALLTKNPLYVGYFDGFKAYDSIHWGGLFAYLNFCGMTKFSNFLFTLYTSTHWAYITGHGRSSSFIPTNGGTQGCPSTCPLYVLYVTPLLNRLDRLSWVVWNISISSLSYVDDLHSIATHLETAREQIQVIKRFNDLNKSRLDPRDGKIKLITNTAGLQVLQRSEPITIDGVELSQANGCILLQARILGGCIHMTDFPCQHRRERFATQHDDLL